MKDIKIRQYQGWLGELQKMMLKVFEAIVRYDKQLASWPMFRTTKNFLAQHFPPTSFCGMVKSLALRSDPYFMTAPLV